MGFWGYGSWLGWGDQGILRLLGVVSVAIVGKTLARSDTSPAATVSTGDDHLMGRFVVSAAARDQLLDANDRGEGEGELGHDQSLTGEQGEGTEGERDESAAEQERDHDPVAVLLVLVLAASEATASGTSEATASSADLIHGALDFLAGRELDLVGRETKCYWSGPIEKV